MAIYKDPDYMKKWRAANKDRIRQYRRKQYIEHREEQIAYSTRWGQENPERFSLQRKAVSANLRYSGKITTADVEAVIARCGRMCHWCGKQDLANRDLTLEHLRPINDPRHLVIACLSCNAAKIQIYGPRKTNEERRADDVRRAAKWRAANIDKARRASRESMRRKRARLKNESRTS